MRTCLLAPALVALAALAAPVVAAPIAGGRVPWGQDLQQALRTARYERKPLVLFFTAEWCGYCKKLAAGALSDDKVVESFKGVLPVVVDCTAEGAHQDLKERYKVSGYPTLVFLDHEGKLVGSVVGAHPPEDVFKAVEATKARVAALTKPKPRATPPGGKPAQPEADSAPGRRLSVHELPSVDAALEKAREEGKLLALVYTVPEQVRREPDVEAVVDALRAPSLKATAPRFLYVWQPLCDELGLDTKDAEAWRARKSPAVVVLDPWAEVKKGERRPALASINKVEDLPGELGRALIEAARAGHPPPTEEEGRTPAR